MPQAHGDVSGKEIALLQSHRVTGSGRPPPVPTERGVRLSRSTLFDRWFTALSLLFVQGPFPWSV
jgi:hypothetical protein